MSVAARFRRRLAAIGLVAVVVLAGAGCTRTPVDAAADDAPTLSGGCAPSTSPYLAANPRLGAGRITWCEGGDAATGTVETTAYPPGTTQVTLLVAGYPDGRDVRLVARAVDGSAQASLLRRPVGDAWAARTLTIPMKLRDRAFTVRVVDRSTAAFGWAGIGFTDRAAAPRAGAMAAIAGVLLIAHAWLVLAALALPAAWRRDAGPLLALAVSALATLVATMVSPATGRVVGIAALLAPLAVVAWRDRRIDARAAAGLAAHWATAPLLAALVLWIGLYPFAWDGTTWQEPALRWRDLPVDNWLPLTFAKMLASGEVLRPMQGDWLASDRPPLQAAVFLMFRDVLPGAEGVAYQTLSTWAQALVLPALAGFVAGVRARGDRALMLFVLATSALVLVNGLFVWPKLLAAAYCAIYHSLLFARADARRGRAAAAGLAAAAALLSHGGAFFALAGSTLALLAWRRREALKPVAVAAIACVVAYTPWALWQRLVDPPGDRLLKWHFAGVVEPTTRRFGEVLRTAYADVDAHEWWLGRWRNLEQLADGAWRVFADIARLATAPGDGTTIRAMVDASFFSPTYACWLFSPLWLLALLRPGARRQDAPLPAGLAPALAFGLAAWVLLMFAPGSTVVHQGAYFLVLALQALAMLATVRVAPGLFRVLAIGNIALAATLYAFDRLGTMPWPVAYAAGTAMLAAALFAACLRRAGGIDDRETT